MHCILYNLYEANNKVRQQQQTSLPMHKHEAIMCHYYFEGVDSSVEIGIITTLSHRDL